MKLLIAGKYIQIDDYVELVSESPLINNFDTQYAQYSNSFEVKYGGDLADLIDISKLRKTTGYGSPYLTIDGHLIDGVIFIPVTILINSFDPNKNTVKINITERINTGLTSGIDIRSTKLTELRHNIDPAIFEGETDEIILPDGTLDGDYFETGDASVLAADPDNYLHSVTPNNWCPLVSIANLVAFLSFKYGLVIESAPDTNFFANRQLPFYGDLITGTIPSTLSTAAIRDFYPTTYAVYSGGLTSTGFLPAGTSIKEVKYTNKIGDSNGWFLSCQITVTGPYGFNPDDILPADFVVTFKGVNLPFISKDGATLYYGIEDLTTELNLNVGASSELLRAITFNVENLNPYDYEFYSDCRFNIDIPNNTVQATSANSRQVFQNMPDVTIIDLFKTIAKAKAQYLELTATGFKFVNIADSLLAGSIVDASPYLIEVKGISYTLYDSPALEYWYKGATTATLVVPIADSRVKSAAKKIEIAMLRTDNDNVSLFESDAVKPLVGIATFPFLDITAQALSLAAFYAAIQNPFVVTATFRNFNLNLSNSILIRQLNGLFVPKKIIKTNRDIVELELLKIEI